MNISVTGTVLDIYANATSLFSMSFDVNGGRMVTAGCDSAAMGVSVTAFNAEVSYVPVAAPSAFLANVTTSPFPCGGPVYGNFIGGPLSLWSDGVMFAKGSTLHGSLAGYEIQTAVWHDPPSSVDEPAGFPLLIAALAVGALVAKFWRKPYER